MNNRDKSNLRKAVHRHIQAHKALEKACKDSAWGDHRKEHDRVHHTLGLIMELVERICERSKPND